MKQKNLISRLRMAVLSLLMLCLSAPAWADGVMGYYDSSTKKLNFYGQGEVDADVISTYVNATAKQNATEVTFDSYITGIAEDAFKEFPNLETVTIPTNITKIGSFAFSKCPNLKTISILGAEGASTLKLGQYAFYKDIDNSANAKLTLSLARQIECLDYSSKQPNSNLFTPDNTYLEQINIGSNIQLIPENLFYNCKGLTTVRFTSKSSVNTIGKKAFLGCTNLTYILTNITSNKLPDTITTIGEAAFYGCI